MFCGKCGSKLPDGAKFCGKCGNPIISEKTKKVEMAEVTIEDIRERYKCLGCNELLDSYIERCPYCDSEVRPISGKSAVVDFSEKLLNADRQKKIQLIRTCHVPNSKEDVLDLAILAKSRFLQQDQNGNGEVDYYEREMAIAWKTLFGQCYSKAKMLIQDERILANFDSMKNEIDAFDRNVKIVKPNAYYETKHTEKESARSSNIKTTQETGWNSWSTTGKVMWVLLNLYTCCIPLVFYLISRAVK